MRHDLPFPRSRFPWLFMGVSGVLLFVTVGLSSSAPAAGGGSELGVWFNDSGRGAVEIRPCGTSGRDANKLCGFIVWLKNPTFKDGRPLYDGYNSDPSKRHRPICGLPVLGNLQRSSEGGYDFGWVYDPEQGQSFDAAIQLRSADRLIMTGYKGVKFFSKSFVWKRAPADLPRCDGTTAAVHETKPAEAAKPQANAQAQPPAANAQTPAQASQAPQAPAAQAKVKEVPATKAKVATAPAQPAAPAPTKTEVAKVPAADAGVEEAPPVETVARASDTDIIPPRPVPAIRPQHPPIE
jgi:uncharacterized protein (DUF2147 family)